MTIPIPDDMSELVDANIDRVDLVGKAANGARFLLAKSAEGHILDADTVADLIKEADLDTSEALEAAEGEGDPETPGSGAWEATDAATARKWTAVLVRAKNALCVLSDREAAEGATADEGDYANAWDLQDAASAIDYAVSVLAPYAAGEEFEAETSADVAEGITKAATGIDPAALEDLEFYAPIVKAGRALSAANEKALKEAAEAIQKVLASLPAPAEEVTKETEAIVADEAPAPEATEEVTKADDLMVAFDGKGKIIGVIDPKNLIPVNDPTPEEAADEAADEAEADPEAPAEDADEDATEAAVKPGEDAEVIPGTNTVQSPADEDPKNVTKAAEPDIAALIEEAVTKALAESTAANAVLAAEVNVLKEQVAAYGREPDDRNSPLLNGATGAATVAKRDGSETDDLEPLTKAVAEATTQDERIQAQKALSMAELRKALGHTDPTAGYRDVANRF